MNVMNFFGSMIIYVNRVPPPNGTGPKAQLRFNLTNLATGYRSPGVGCVATARSLEPHEESFNETSTGWFDCTDHDLRDHDAVQTEFRFNPDSGFFEIRQEWECKSDTGGERSVSDLVAS